jgi:hypothetical protein
VTAGSPQPHSSHSHFAASCCVHCGGVVEDAAVSVGFADAGAIISYEGVPGRRCRTCGAHWSSLHVNEALTHLARQALANGGGSMAVTYVTVGAPQQPRGGREIANGVYLVPARDRRRSPRITLREPLAACITVNERRADGHA